MKVAEKEGRPVAEVQKSVSKQLDLDIKAFYLLISEPKDASAKIMIDMERYPLNSVDKWWKYKEDPKEPKEPIDPLNKPIITNYQIIQQSNKTSNFGEIKEVTEDKFCSVLEETIKDEDKSNMLQDANEEEDEYQSVEPSPEITIHEAAENSEIPLQKKGSLAPVWSKDYVQPNPIDSWNQNLLLMLEVTEVSGHFCHQKDKKIFTKVHSSLSLM